MSWEPLHKGHIASSLLTAHKMYFTPLGVSHRAGEGILTEVLLQQYISNLCMHLQLLVLPRVDAVSRVLGTVVNEQG